MCHHNEKPASPMKPKFAKEDDEESQDGDRPFIHRRLAVREDIGHLDKHLVIIVGKFPCGLILNPCDTVLLQHLLVLRFCLPFLNEICKVCSIVQIIVPRPTGLEEL
ncbi:hypothetical protein HPB47_005798 [Ixodes persulcatus]|uniref:Uncharacterized protein n=1 Tax=Ixodes persulcatus TaxID=34615 RepID=A0AC60PCX7_IXOPE|nr:hypothetical protein HPB47_005798 [Ixodes persulcatus]